MSIWGDEHDRKTQVFNDAVEAIEKKYSHIFEDHVNVITGEKPDKLLFQFLTSWDSSAYRIGFRKDTYVPKYIQDEVINAFKSAYSAK
jgi:hypothetical protein